MIGAAGALLLLFHIHSGDMEAPHAMETMGHIQRRIIWFAAVGLAVAMTELLAERPQTWREIFKKVWPAWSVVLGLLLTLSIRNR